MRRGYRCRCPEAKELSSANPTAPEQGHRHGRLGRLIVGSAGTWWVVHPRPSDWFPVQVLEGNAYFNSHHSAFALTFKDGSQFFGEVGATDGHECIPKPDLSTADNILMDIRVGVVRAAPTAHQFGREMVVWIRCLGPPTKFPSS